jgi:hypothetical protein
MKKDIKKCSVVLLILGTSLCKAEMIPVGSPASTVAVKTPSVLPSAPAAKGVSALAHTASMAVKTVASVAKLPAPVPNLPPPVAKAAASVGSAPKAVPVPVPMPPVSAPKVAPVSTPAPAAVASTVQSPQQKKYPLIIPPFFIVNMSSEQAQLTGFTLRYPEQTSTIGQPKYIKINLPVTHTIPPKTNKYHTSHIPQTSLQVDVQPGSNVVEILDVSIENSPIVTKFAGHYWQPGASVTDKVYLNKINGVWSLDLVALNNAQRQQAQGITGTVQAQYADTPELANIPQRINGTTQATTTAFVQVQQNEAKAAKKTAKQSKAAKSVTKAAITVQAKQ